jgi:adenine-specific DNA-methyltransferase
MTKEQKFYSLVQDLFVGAKLEGDSGYVNLMNIKTDYFNKIREKIKAEVEEKFGNDSPEDLYAKLYTFFDSYFSDGGAIFFSSTPDYKNIYAKVYNPREDVSLFWKTSRLYYVKSEANYRTIENLQIPAEPELAFDFHFDASLLKLKQANEKKELEFYFTGVKTRKGKKVIKFHVAYKNDNAIKKLKEVLEIDDTKKLTAYVLENPDKIKGKLTFKSEGLDLKKVNEKGGREFAKANLLVEENKDLLDGLTVYAAISDTAEIEKYLGLKGVTLMTEIIVKAHKIYKKQTEIDYFIHKDAKGFLREQFDLYAYEHILGQSSLDTIYDQKALNNERKVKEIAYLAIDYIGNFEDELKKIWLKPKFARKSNYVVTLDRLADKKGGMDVVEKILKHKGIIEQVAEWQELGIVDKEFDQKQIVIDKKLNKDWEKLPVDTKFFKDLELEIIGLFDNLDEELDGRLIKSDNFQALNTLLPKYKEQVQTIYIDPPFNTGDDFEYIDRFQNSSWLTLMDNRFELVSNVLKDSGSLFLHLDRNADYYGRHLLNKNLSDDNFKAEITWDTAGTTGFKNSPTNWIKNSDNIFHFSKNQPGKFNKLFTLLNVQDPNLAKIERKDKNIGWLDLQKDEKGAYIESWESGSFKKKYIEVDSKLEPIGMIWTDILSFLYTQVGNNESYFFSGGQKPENLLRRILQSASDKGDIVLDFFLGIGTTIAVAHKLNRKWIGVEMGEHFGTFYDDKKKIGVLGRMKIVLFGDQVFHVFGSIRHPQLSRNINWRGGGFFKYYELEQYEDALKKAGYNPADGELENIDFSLSEKQARVALDIDLKKEKASFVFEKLYPDVDIPETISNLFGKKIKTIIKDKVVFTDDSEIDLNNLDFKKYESLKKLIYW